MNYSKISEIISLIIICIFTIWLVWYISNNSDNFISMKNISIHSIIILSIFYLLTLILNGLYTKVILRSFYINLGFIEWFGTSVVTTMGNILMPFRAGAGLKAVYLKMHHNLSISYFLSTLSSVYIFNLIVFSFLGIISLLYLFSINDVFRVIIFFIAILFISIACIIIKPLINEDSVFPLNKLAKIVKGWNLIRNNKLLITKLIFITVLLACFDIIRLYICFNAINVSISIWIIILITSVLSLSSLINLTPGSFGVHETITIFLGSIFNYSSAEALLVHMLLRGIFLIEILIFGPIFMRLLIKKIK